MSHFLSFIKKQLKYFFINPFWKDRIIWVILAITIILNVVIWYKYIKYEKTIIDLLPIVYSTAIFILNLFLSIISYPKKDLIAYVLMGAGLLIQIFFLYYLAIIKLAGVF